MPSGAQPESSAAPQTFQLPFSLTNISVSDEGSFGDLDHVEVTLAVARSPLIWMSLTAVVTVPCSEIISFKFALVNAPIKAFDKPVVCLGWPHIIVARPAPSALLKSVVKVLTRALIWPSGEVLPPDKTNLYTSTPAMANTAMAAKTAMTGIGSWDLFCVEPPGVWPGVGHWVCCPGGGGGGMFDGGGGGGMFDGGGGGGMFDGGGGGGAGGGGLHGRGDGGGVTGARVGREIGFRWRCGVQSCPSQ
jgi:hypothetical protein